MKKTSEKNWLAFLSLALLLGIALRLSFPGDIEYKEDEQYMFKASQAVGVTEPWPDLGMKSGVKIQNPGMSVWVFVALARLTHATTPVELAQAVQWMNILALLILAFFSYRIVLDTERPYWLWATALAAVNPFAVLFHRKIWAQCTLPLLCVLLWIAWHYRRKWSGAFFWGVLGVCLGQIHLSGFFMAAGVFLWTYLKDRKNVCWPFWIAGSALGAIPLIPWLQYLANYHGNGPFNPKSLTYLVYPRYWGYWITDSLGIGLTYSLKTVHFLDFLRYPLIGDTGTYLVALLHLIIVGAGILILKSWHKAGGLKKNGYKSETGLALGSLMIVTGLLMTVATIGLKNSVRHYLIMSFPLEWVWLAKFGSRDPKEGQKYLAVIWTAELLLSACFLLYIHINHGDPLGDYGVAYQYQGQ